MARDPRLRVRQLARHDVKVRPANRAAADAQRAWYPCSNGVDAHEHRGRPAFAEADEQAALQPGMGRRRGLEGGRGAEVHALGRHRLAAQEPRHVLRRGVAQAAVDHVHQRAVGEAERVARLDLGHPVRADELEIRAPGQDLPLQPRPGHAAAEDGHDPPLPGRARAEEEGRRDLRLDRADEVEARRRRLRHELSAFRPSISRASAGEAGSRLSSLAMRTVRSTSISFVASTPRLK